MSRATLSATELGPQSKESVVRAHGSRAEKARRGADARSTLAAGQGSLTHVREGRERLGCELASLDSLSAVAASAARFRLALLVRTRRRLGECVRARASDSR